MRSRLLFLLAALLALPACARSSTGPADTIGVEQVEPGAAVDASSAQQAVVDFLNGYASVGRDNGNSLMASIAPDSSLVTWAKWLGIKAQVLEHLQGQPQAADLIGRVKVAGLDFLQSQISASGKETAAVGVDASVTFTQTLNLPQPADATFAFVGPAFLQRTTAGWRVEEIARNGVALANAVAAFKGDTQSRGGLAVTLDSAFLFQGGWVFNLFVQNRSGASGDVGQARLTLNGNGQRLVNDPLPGSLFLKAPEGTRTPEILAFPPPSTIQGLTLDLAFRLTSGKTYAFRFDLFPLLAPKLAPGQLPSPAATGPATPGPATTAAAGS